VQIVARPIVREPDGLAMSSRNAYLIPQQKQSALAIYRSLLEVQKRFARGEQRPDRLIEQGGRFLGKSRQSSGLPEIVDPIPSTG